ncbi:MAG: DUF4058 family protein [Thermoguttaceae bacterium]|nr:DUF4058 family protein [Thermoguttaceae bacterium]
MRRDRAPIGASASAEVRGAQHAPGRARPIRRERAVGRAKRRHEVEIWPIALEQPLPVVPVPLLPEDPAVPLDLQRAFATVYDIFRYDELIDYSQPPPGPLRPDQAAWVEEQLHRADRRKG